MVSGLPLVLIPRPKLTGILTECTVTTSVSRALNLEFDCESLSNTLHSTSPDKWSFLLKLIPKGLSFFIYLILNGYPHHITIAHILQSVLKEIVHDGKNMSYRITIIRGVIIARWAAFLRHCTAYTVSWLCRLSQICEPLVFNEITQDRS